MWYDVLTKLQQVELLREDSSVLMNFPVYYEDSKYWEDIDMISVVPNPVDALSSTT